MGQQQSKDELLYQKAIDADIEAIKALCSQGAGLEWIDKEGKTPLIVACMNPDRYILAKTLIGLGANVNAYRPGRHAGTPLHHAAKRGLDLTVRLLLSHGANPFLRNDDWQSPLDVARFRGFTNVVRTIESHIFLFSGWLREFYGPGFLEVLAPQLLSRKSWVVIIPCGPRNPTKPLKLKLAVYSNLQDAQPRAVVALWKANIEEPKFHQPDPMLIIFDKSTKTRYKFASSNDGDRQQIQSMYLACRGIPQVMPYSGVHDTQPSAPTTSTQTAEEAAEIAMAINASIQSAMENRLPLQPHNHQISGTDKLNGWVDTPSDTVNNGWGSASGSSHPEKSSSGLINEPTKEQHNGWGMPKSRLNNDQIQANYVTPPPPSQTSGGINEPSKEEYGGWGVPQSRLNNNRIQSPKVNNSGWLDDPAKEEYNGWGVAESRPTNNATEEATYIPQSCNVPSAPPVTMEVLDEGPIQYPSIDFSPVDLSTPCVESENAGTSSEAKDEDGSSCCVICWEAPVEGACIPCGHMAGCMSCLNEVKTKKGDCPVCRTEIKQVIRLYAV